MRRKQKLVVVCDSSALIPLSLINQLHLLEELYGGVFIPPGVHDEVVRRGGGRAGAEEVQNAPFIRVEPLRDPRPIALYTGELSPEDAEVLVLAKEQNADVILTRDRGLRRRARREGVITITVLALFLDAKRAGFISEVKPLLDELRSKGVLIREGVYQETLRQAGELPRGRRGRNVR